jgi:integrase/recombinase XerD
VDEAIRQFLDYLRYQKERSVNTILAYKRDIVQFVTILSKAGVTIEPEKIPAGSVEYYLDWLTTQDYKSSTIARKCAAVRGFIEFWWSDEILPLHFIDNQVRDLETTRNSPNVLTKNQILELLAEPMKLNTPLGLRDAAILVLMYETGLRATDIIQLALEDVDLPGKRIKPISAGKKVWSIVDSVDHLERYLLEGRPHLARIPEERSLFLNQRGMGLTRQGVWFIVNRWANAAQLDGNISPNTIRHSLIQHLMESGLSNKEILLRLGLKSPNSLRVFNHVQERQGADD